MTNFLDLIDNMRRTLLEKTESLTVEQLNTIPYGFNNNIVWNLGHILVVTDELLYKNSPFSIPSYEFETTGFKKGTKPDTFINEREISLIRSALAETVPRFRKLINDYATTTQINLIEIFEKFNNDKSVQFTLFHEDLHLTTIFRQLKLV